MHFCDVNEDAVHKRYLEARREKVTMVDISQQEGVDTICWDGETRRSYVEVNDAGWPSENGGHYIEIDGQRVPVHVRMFAERLHAISLAAVDERSWGWVDDSPNPQPERVLRELAQDHEVRISPVLSGCDDWRVQIRRTNHSDWATGYGECLVDALNEAKAMRR